MTNGPGKFVNEKKYAVLTSFLTMQEQRQLVSDALTCHSQHSSSGTAWTGMGTSTASFPLKLGIGCGGNLSRTLPFAVDLARRAFASSSVPHNVEDCNLTGLSLLYGPNATMNAHCDSPTQPQQREEWLVMMTVGNSVRFRCDDELLLMQSRFGTYLGPSRAGIKIRRTLVASLSPMDASTSNMSEAVELDEGTMACLFGGE